jgi:hypothetical protein
MHSRDQTTKKILHGIPSLHSLNLDHIQWPSITSYHPPDKKKTGFFELYPALRRIGPTLIGVRGSGFRDPHGRLPSPLQARRKTKGLAVPSPTCARGWRGRLLRSGKKPCWFHDRKRRCFGLATRNRSTWTGGTLKARLAGAAFQRDLTFHERCRFRENG